MPLRRVSVHAKTSLGSSTVYEVEVHGVSYGRCRKKWDDFEELYDSLDLRYDGKVREIEFPRYQTRKNARKKDAVEENRKGLEDLLARLISHPDISSDPDLAAFLQLTERVGIAEEHSKQQTPSESLRDRPGPTPFTVHNPAVGHDMDEADAGGGEDMHWLPRGGEGGAQNGGTASGSSAMEPGQTVLLGQGSFPAP